MNLEDIKDENTSTKKMRIALRRGDAKEETKRQTKQKNPNASTANVQSQDGPNDMEGSEEENAEFIGE